MFSSLKNVQSRLLFVTEKIAKVDCYASAGFFSSSMACKFTSCTAMIAMQHAHRGTWFWFGSKSYRESNLETQLQPRVAPRPSCKCLFESDILENISDCAYFCSWELHVVPKAFFWTKWIIFIFILDNLLIRWPQKWRYFLSSTSNYQKGPTATKRVCQRTQQLTNRHLTSYVLPQ